MEAVNALIFYSGKSILPLVGEAAHHHLVNSGSDYFSVTIKHSGFICNQSLSGSLLVPSSPRVRSPSAPHHPQALLPTEVELNHFMPFFPSTKCTIQFCLTASQAPSKPFCASFHRNVEIPVRFSSPGMILPLPPMGISPLVGPS